MAEPNGMQLAAKFWVLMVLDQGAKHAQRKISTEKFKRIPLNFIQHWRQERRGKRQDLGRPAKAVSAVYGGRTQLRRPSAGRDERHRHAGDPLRPLHLPPCRGGTPSVYLSVCLRLPPRYLKGASSCHGSSHHAR